MDEEHIRMAASRFWRRGPGQGSGLGLSIVNAVAARFAGRFTLERRDGGGMRATLALPRAAERSQFPLPSPGRRSSVDPGDQLANAPHVTVILRIVPTQEPLFERALAIEE